MTVALRRAGADDRVLVERLVQLEQHDLSDVTGALPGDDGLFPVLGLERFFDEHGSAYLVEHDGAPVGVALVRPVEGTSFVHSFFVVRALRRRGAGTAAAALLLDTDDGPWTIAVLERYDAAAQFWRRFVGSCCRTSSLARREHDGQTFLWFRLGRLP